MYMGEGVIICPYLKERSINVYILRGIHASLFYTTF